MNPEIKERWATRLESGDIKQTRGVLGRPNGNRCCLGVLCDIAVEDGIIAEPEETVHDDGKLCLSFADSETDLPLEVMEWAELDSSDPDYGKLVPGGKHPGRMITLAHLNDTSKYNFKKIAQVVRKHF